MLKPHENQRDNVIHNSGSRGVPFFENSLVPCQPKAPNRTMTYHLQHTSLLRTPSPLGSELQNLFRTSEVNVIHVTPLPNPAPNSDRERVANQYVISAFLGSSAKAAVGGRDRNTPV